MFIFGELKKIKFSFGLVVTEWQNNCAISYINLLYELINLRTTVL